MSTGGPVVVLTYRHAGTQRLRSLLAERPELACTAGTGLLPLCEQAALTWRQSEGRDESLSALALASIRALAGSVITALLAREGKRRWCETAVAAPGRAETFLRIYPEARFVCLHRNCADVIRSIRQADPWGPTDHEFGPFILAYPGRSAAALAAYWAARTEPMLTFEAAHPDACLRLRYEDLVRDPDLAAAGLRAFLALDDCRAAAPRWADGHEGSAPALDAPVPVAQLPPPLRSRVNELLTRLSYPELA